MKQIVPESQAKGEGSEYFLGLNRHKNRILEFSHVYKRKLTTETMLTRRLTTYQKRLIKLPLSFSDCDLLTR